jgi:hypothetical protein
VKSLLSLNEDGLLEQPFVDVGVVEICREKI